MLGCSARFLRGLPRPRGCLPRLFLLLPYVLSSAPSLLPFPSFRRTLGEVIGILFLAKISEVLRTSENARAIYCGSVRTRRRHVLCCSGGLWGCARDAGRWRLGGRHTNHEEKY